jgi:hypothetical protein
MTMFPTWALERFAYWIVFALMVLSIERVGRNLNWNIFEVKEEAVTAIILLGIAILLIWAVFHL